MNKMSHNEVLEKAKEDFLLRDLSERTQETYLRVFDCFLESSGETEYTVLTESHLRKWLLKLKGDRKLSNATINQYNSACKFLLKVVLVLDVNDSQVPNSKLKRKPQPSMTVDEIKELFSHFNNLTVFTYFTLLYSTGIRRSEALGITAMDIIRAKNDKDSHYLVIRNGKGGYTRNVELPDATYMLLRKYYEEEIKPTIVNITKEEKAGIKTMPLFPTIINGVKANSFFTKAFNNGRNSSIKFREYHPHILRHSFAVHMLQKNINNILRVQANLGHKSLATTEIYLKDAKLYGVKNAVSPSEVAKELCTTFYARAKV